MYRPTNNRVELATYYTTRDCENRILRVNSDMEIRRLDTGSKYELDLNLLLNEEWPDIGSFENEKYGISIPNPIGIIENGKVVGGLFFTSYKAPSSEEIVVWVNAVLVKPSFRGQGLGIMVECLFCETCVIFQSK